MPFSVLTNLVFTNRSFFQQLESLPILDLYKYTLPEGTQDCENDPAYDRDQVYNFFDIFMNDNILMTHLSF